MGFNMDDVMEALQIVKDCKDAELHIDTGEMKLSLFKGNLGDSSRSPLVFSGSAAAASPQPAAEASAAAATAAPAEQNVEEVCIVPPVETEPEEINEEGLVPVMANVTSVFYRKPSPEEPPFVEVGDEVQEDSVICLLEVMKCFRQVTADTKGIIAKICVESNNLVEQGTTLFLIRPS